MGHTTWQQYCCEHGIDKDGNLANTTNIDIQFRTFFEESIDGRYHPRNIMIDTEKDVIDSIRNNDIYSQLYLEDTMISSNESSNNTYAQAYYRQAIRRYI